MTQTTPAEEREPLGHELTAHEATDADCTKAGNTAYWSCDRCGKFFEDAEGDSEIEEGSWIIPALEHDLTYHAAVTATCADGNKEYWECENCGKYFADENATRELRWNEIVMPATGNHVWGEGEVTKEPTCTEKGVKTYTCTVCGETKTEDVAMIAHTLEKVDRIAPTCRDEGQEEHYKCTVCEKLFSDADGKNEIEAPVAIAKVDHTWNEGEVTKEPTCTEKGVKTYTCTVCGETKTEDVAMIPHALQPVAKKDATYKEEGYEAYYKCTECGKLFSDADGKNEIEAPVTIPSFKEDAEAKAAAAAEAAKTPGAAAVAAAEAAEEAARIAAEKAAADETLSDEEKEAAAQAYEDAKAATQRARDAKAAAEAAAAVPSEVADYSLPTIKNYKPTRGKTWIKARWKKLSKKNRKKVDGIEIQYSTNSSFTDGNTWTVKKTSKTKKIKRLARKTRYYTRVRTYKYIGGVKHVSGWSRIKNNKTK